ncbi:MAG: hypothetical protein WDN06_12355 [Asticcacaulis sp.]
MSAAAGAGNSAARLVAILVAFLVFHLATSEMDSVLGYLFTPLTELVGMAAAVVLALGVAPAWRGHVVAACLFMGGTLPILVTFWDSTPQEDLARWIYWTFSARAAHVVAAPAFVLALLMAGDAFSERDRAKGFAVFPVARSLAWAAAGGVTLYTGLVNQNFQDHTAVFRATVAFLALACCVAFIARDDTATDGKRGPVFVWDGARIRKEIEVLLRDWTFVRLFVAAVLVVALSNTIARYRIPWETNLAANMGDIFGRIVVKLLYPAAVLAGAFVADATRRKSEGAGIRVAMWAVLLSLPLFLVGIYSSSDGSIRIAFALAQAACGAIMAPVFAAAADRPAAGAKPLAIAAISAIFILVPMLGFGDVVAAVLMKMFAVVSTADGKVNDRRFFGN